ncbi:MAG: FtsX-like permease family protein, partial [Muribaculaceae bacterium]|nr:FtsX-like permease family protein [Muribaculaceae bacterium]
VEELDNMHLGANDCIITQELAERAFPGENAVGKIVKSVYADPQRVVGVRGNMRFTGYMNSYLLTLSQPADIRPEAIYAGGSFSLIVRLRPGESTARFIKDKNVRSSLNLGNFYCADIQSLDNLGKTEENNRGVTGSKIIGIGLLIFFMGSLTIGVTGIFWLQTRSRSREAGIMKSFGASPGFITGTMLWEGIILVAVTWLAGCLIYLQWGLANGLADHNRISVAPNILHIDWLVNFPIHFAVISAIVLVIMTVVVCAGIYIPAVRISRVNPVDALHDE